VTLRIGGLDAQGPAALARPYDLEVSEDGSIYVFDRQLQEVRVFDSSGSFIRTIGRKGDGPGEHRGAQGIALAPDGSVWSQDSSLGRLTQFAQDGRVLNTIPHPRSGVSPWPGRFQTDGSLLAWGSSFVRPPGTDTGYFSAFPIRADLNAGLFDTLPAVEWRLAYLARGGADPAADRRTVATGYDGDIWFSTLREYDVFHRAADGDTLLWITREGVLGPTITPAMADSMAEQRNEFSLILSSGPISAADYPPSEPVIHRLVPDPSGYLFVMIAQDDLPLGEAFDVFDAETGRFLDRLALPVPLLTEPPPVVRDGVLYGVSPGAFDAPILVRIALIGHPAGAGN
jgi:hypothetical protein